MFDLKSWLLAAVVLASASTTAVAQDKMNVYLANEKWFISGGVGPSIYIGDYDGQAKFGDRISVAAEIAGGKWITPSFGARLQMTGMHANGKGYEGRYDESWNLMQIHVDIMADVITLIKGVDEERFYRAIPFIGGGVALAGKKNPRQTGVFAIGVLNSFRIAKQLDANIELKGTIVGDKLDGLVGGRSGEGTVSMTVGFSYYF